MEMVSFLQFMELPRQCTFHLLVYYQFLSTLMYVRRQGKLFFIIDLTYPAKMFSVKVIVQFLTL